MAKARKKSTKRRTRRTGACVSLKKPKSARGKKCRIVKGRLVCCPTRKKATKRRKKATKRRTRR